MTNEEIRRVKAYRERVGCSLVEAKRAVERNEDCASPPPSPPSDREESGMLHALAVLISACVQSGMRGVSCDFAQEKARQAVLDEFSRALARARREGIEEAAKVADAMEDEMFDRYADACRSAGMTPYDEPAVNVCGAIADRIRALMAPGAQEVNRG